MTQIIFSRAMANNKIMVLPMMLDILPAVGTYVMIDVAQIIPIKVESIFLNLSKKSYTVFLTPFKSEQEINECLQAGWKFIEEIDNNY